MTRFASPVLALSTFLAAAAATPAQAAPIFDQTCQTTSQFMKISRDGDSYSFDLVLWHTDGAVPPAPATAPDLVLTEGQIAGGGGNYSILFRDSDDTYVFSYATTHEEGPIRYVKVYKGDIVTRAELCL